MSRIDELVRRLCPHGVPHRSAGEVLRYEQPGPYIVHSTEYSIANPVPVLTAGQAFVLGFTAEESGVFEASPDAPVIIFDDFTTASRWVDFRFKVKSSAIKLLRARDPNELNLRFAYFWMQTVAYRPREHARQWIGTYAHFKIPVPPLEVQAEVVRILDTFVQVEAGLEAELRARRRQYAGYRDELCAGLRERSTRWAQLGDVGAFFGGLTGKVKADFANGDARFVSYVNVFNNIDVDTVRADYVRVDPGERQTQLRLGDVIFTGSSETLDEVGMSSVVTRDPTGPLYLNSFCIGYRFDDAAMLEPEFAKHLFRSSVMREQIVSTASGVTRFNISKSRLARVEVPIPERGEQLRMAGVLNNLIALVNDASIGLPAELEARRKQYEYYRDKLLTFPEAAA